MCTNVVLASAIGFCGSAAVFHAHVHTPTHMHTSTNLHTHTHTHTHTHAYIHTHPHTHTHTHPHTHTSTHPPTHTQHASTHPHTHAAMSCPPPQIADSNLKHANSSYGFGAVLEVECDWCRVMLEGEGELVCTTSGEWDKPLPKCQCECELSS